MFVMVSYVFMFLSTDWLLFSDYLLNMCSCLYNSLTSFMSNCFLQQFYRPTEMIWYVCMYVSKSFCFVASFTTCWLVSVQYGPIRLCCRHKFNNSKVEYRKDFKLIFCLPMLAWPKNASCFFPFDIFDARNIKPAAAMHMSWSFSFFLKHHMIYLLLCSCPLNVHRTEHWNI